MPGELLRFLTCGSVDDGKSTLIGRLLLDAGGVPDDQVEVDPAFITDGLKAEREQGITIDVAYRYFATPRRSFIIADTPGHEQYTRNMVSGASTCDLAVILVDVTAGPQVQTRRHAAIASLLGIRHIVLAVNKMDLVGWAQAPYDEVCASFLAFAAKLGAVDVRCLPVSARAGDNVVRRSDRMPWHQGETLLHVLETVRPATGRNPIDLRLPVQRACRPDDSFRGYQGSVRSGTLRVGDEVVVLPSGASSTVAAIARGDEAVTTASAPDPVTVEFATPLDITRGDVIVHARNQPRVSHRIEAMVVWLGQAALVTGGRYLVKHLTSVTGATLTEVAYRLEVEDLRRVPAGRLELNEFGRCRFDCDRPLPWDAFDRNRATGAFIVIDRLTSDTVGAGMIIDRLPESSDDHLPARRRARGGLTIWLTGLSGAGKSTIAEKVAASLREAGTPCFVLDGDRVRTGLNSDLGFSPADRAENVRRIAEVAALFNTAGLVVLVPVIAPFADDRARARTIIGAQQFREVWVDAPLDVCESRDVKGLYKKARAGDLREFTGVSSPYESPSAPDLVVKSAELTVDQAAQLVLALLETAS